MIPQDNILCRSLSIFFNLMLVAFWKGFGLEKKICFISEESMQEDS